jgi:putative tricarboxylic transport membrane protein
MMGIEFVPIAVGLFGLTEILVIASQRYVPRIVSKVRLRELYPTEKETRRSVAPVARGTVLGFFTGLLPGPSAAVATFLSYALEKKLSKNPEEFGSGAIEGVSGPETANNSAAIASFIPLLTLGIPFSPTSAVLLAGLILHNVEPGPLLFQNNSQIFWTLIAGLYVGNIMLLILNLPFVGYFARVATIKPPLLMPVISMICLMGVYAVRNSFFDIWVMVISGIVGVVFRKYKYPVAPLIIGLILGPITEYSFRQMLMMFRGDMFLIFERPIAVTFFLMALGALLFSVFGRSIRNRIAARTAEP